MARDRSMVVAGLNIRANPHPPGIYVEIFKAAHELRRAIPVFGETHLLISYLDTGKASAEAGGIITGRLAKFTEIDPSAPWFNTEKLDKANDTEVSEINIPENLRPNYKSGRFSFDIPRHRLAFEHYGYDINISARMAKKFFDVLLNQAELLNKFGHIKVDIISDHENLETMLSSPMISSIRIVVSRPNADDFGHLDSLFGKGLVDQNASKAELTISREPGDYIKPNETTRAAAAIALEHGRVDITSQQNGRAITISTEDSPKLEVEKYNPDTTSDAGVFARLARKLSSFRSR